MKIAIRTDASIQIGSGHVMRCLTLANALRQNGADCTFICRAHTGHLLELIKQHGHNTVELPVHIDHIFSDAHSANAHAAWLGTGWANDAAETKQAIENHQLDWLVIDHYALDFQWEKKLRPHCKQLMVIDDLGNRKHDCDLLLDQNLGRKEEHYQNLVPQSAKKLMGPQYALLRPEFEELREISLTRRSRPTLKQLLITLGGVDNANVTSDVLTALCQCTLPTELCVTVVMGKNAPWLDHVRTLAEAMPRPTKVLVNVANMAQLMTDSDLVIGAAGGTAWEFCCLGLPAIVLCLADNQHAGVNALAQSGAALFIEDSNKLMSLFGRHFSAENYDALLSQLSQTAAAITQGRGTSLVINEMEHLHA